jgi:hypothetical protein
MVQPVVDQAPFKFKRPPTTEAVVAEEVRQILPATPSAADFLELCLIRSAMAALHRLAHLTFGPVLTVCLVVTPGLKTAAPPCLALGLVAVERLMAAVEAPVVVAVRMV